MRRGLAALAALSAVAAALVAGPALGNGFGASDAPPARIPIPARSFSATVEDQTGVRVTLTDVTYNGEVFVYGTLGAAQITVPFEKIREVRIEPTDTATKRIAFVVLTDGTNVQVVVDADTPAYGRTGFGTYSLPIEKARRIEFVAP